MLTLLLMGMLTLASNFQPAKAESNPIRVPMRHISVNVKDGFPITPTRRVLFDMLHVEQFRFYYSYSRLSDELSARGYVLYQFGREQWDAGQLTYDMLENFDTLVLPNPQIVPFAPSEVEAITDFVQNGGGLLVLGGSYPVSDSDYPVKDIITHFGIEYELPITELNAFVTDISPHPITRNVTKLYMPSVEALNITIPAQGVAFSQGKPVIAVTESGSGRVVVIAAEHMFANWAIETYDNLLLALNAFEWLSELGGGPYPQELPLIKVTSWNPPTSMFVGTDYAVNVEIQNFGNDSITVVVTIPSVPIFNKTGWGVGEVIGDSRSINVPSGTTENVSLTIRAPVCGYTCLETYVYAPFSSSYLVFDGKYTDKIQILTQQPVANFTWNPLIPKVEEPVTFDGSASTPNGGTITKYEWDFGDSECATGKMVTHAYSSPGTYTVTLNVTDSEGLWDIEQNQIQIVQPYGPKAEFTAIPETANVGESIKFDVSGSLLGWNGTHEMPITEYRWDFGDGNKTTTPIPIVYHSFSSSGIYYVTLTVYAPGATPETDTTSRKVTIISVPVGGYSVPIKGYSIEKPLTLYLALVAILTVAFTAIKRETHRRKKETPEGHK